MKIANEKVIWDQDSHKVANVLYQEKFTGTEFIFGYKLSNYSVVQQTVNLTIDGRKYDKKSNILQKQG